MTRPYLAIFGARFRLLLQYRAAAAAGVGCQFFWGLIKMMIFAAFYDSAVGPPMDLQQVVTYVWLGQAFIVLVLLRIDPELQELVRTGNVACEMLRPVDLYFMWYSRSVAGCVAPGLLRAPAILLAATLAGWVRWPAAPVILAFFVSLLAAALLAGAMSNIMNIFMLRAVSGRGIMSLFTLATWLLSGMIVPLPLFPSFLQPLAYALPFRGLCDTPFRLFAGSIPLERAAGDLLHQLAWTAAIIAAGRWLLSRSLGRLVVQGG